MFVPYFPLASTIAPKNHPRRPTAKRPRPDVADVDDAGDVREGAGEGQPVGQVEQSPTECFALWDCHLVGGLEHEFYFSIIYGIILPN